MKRNTEEHANTSKAKANPNKQNNNENQKSSNWSDLSMLKCKK